MSPPKQLAADNDGSGSRDAPKRARAEASPAFPLADFLTASCVPSREGVAAVKALLALSAPPDPELLDNLGVPSVDFARVQLVGQWLRAWCDHHIRTPADSEAPRIFVAPPHWLCGEVEDGDSLIWNPASYRPDRDEIFCAAILPSVSSTFTPIHVHPAELGSSQCLVELADVTNGFEHMFGDVDDIVALVARQVVAMASKDGVTPAFVPILSDPVATATEDNPHTGYPSLTQIASRMQRIMRSGCPQNLPVCILKRNVDHFFAQNLTRFMHASSRASPRLAARFAPRLVARFAPRGSSRASRFAPRLVASRASRLGSPRASRLGSSRASRLGSSRASRLGSPRARNDSSLKGTPFQKSPAGGP